jgi:CheY-like chemotaxis protein
MARLLIVDDNRVDMQMLKDAIIYNKDKFYDSNYGLTIHEARDGIEALEIMEMHHYELIITDIIMAKLSGWEFIRKVREKHSQAELPIIVVSAIDGVELEYNAIKNGASAWFTKPIKEKEFSKQVFDLIQER